MVFLCVSAYPRAVDTAVRNEVLGLRRLGHSVHTFAIRQTAPRLPGERVPTRTNTTGEVDMRPIVTPERPRL